MVASSRDLVEAHAYDRRRLINAFVRGAAHDHGPEPVRVGRAILGGVILAALAVVASVVTRAVDLGGLVPWLS